MNKRHTFPILMMLVFTVLGCSKEVSIKSLVEQMPDKERLTQFPAALPYQLKQVSSYNRKTQTPGNYDWYANYDASYFVRVEANQGRREFVMMDEEGPGAVVRWWMTFWRAHDGILRIYLDHDSLPEIEGSPGDLISGQMLVGKPLSVAVPEEGPPAEWGHNLYLRFLLLSTVRLPTNAIRWLNMRTNSSPMFFITFVTRHMNPEQPYKPSPWLTLKSAKRC